MAFETIKQAGFPRRLWGLVGFSGVGKSTFSTQLRGPLLVIDADHRYEEVAHLAAETPYRLQDAASNVLIHRIDEQLRSEMPETRVGTIIVDSLTQIVAPLTSKAVADNAADRNKNKAAAFIEKAVGMRWLQSSVSMWGTDVLWVWHEEDARDNKAQKVVRETIPQLEIARLRRNLNAMLKVVQKDGKRGIRVVWSRGKSGMTLWDESGRWAEIPERLEEAMYKDVSAEALRDSQLPTTFTGPDAAVDWAVRVGRYPNKKAARASYDKLKVEHTPKGAAAMWDLWIAHVAMADTAEAGVEEF